ncbi:transmembrane proteins 14C-domain-containing protein [Chytriomyces sp. MP71]|nr:transmembrane proteins 14C-domain-containing protein [Chytriomyces sp. MP71]
MADHLANSLAVVCALGGTVGYVKSKSIPSLAAGIAFGGLYGLTGYLIRKNADYGVELGLGTSMLLLGAVGPRAVTTRARVPLGMAGLGALGSAYFAKKYWQQTYGV